MKKRVIHIIHELKIGGVEAAALSSVELLNSNFEFWLFCVGDIDTSLVKYISDMNRTQILSLKSKKSLLKIIEILNSDPTPIIISSLWKSHLVHFLIRLFFRVKYSVVFIHSSRFFHIFDYIFTKLSLQFSNEVWTDSRSANQFMVSHTKLDIHIISFILKAPKYIVKKNESLSSFKIIFLGRLANVKRLDLIVSFISALRKKNLRVTLDVYGPDQKRLSLLKHSIAQYQLQEYVHYKGKCKFEEVEELLTNYNGFVLMSDFEGMAISAVQALQAGLVCFLRNVGEISNYGVHLQNAVILNSIEDSDWQRFIDESVKVLNSPEKIEKISQKAKETFRDVKQYQNDVLHNLLRISI